MLSDVCKHCHNAPCLGACSTGALFKTEFDTVAVQQDICNGCGYCIPACPFGVVDQNTIDGKARKRTLCYDRLKGGLEPACAKSCPTNSIQFGWVVGGYIFLAGLSGASALLAAAADRRRGRDAGGLVRRGRCPSLLAPTVGSVLLVWDLHTPQRFHNVFRVAKRTSPMSIGTWALTAFSGFAGLSAAAQFGADRGWRWARRAARVVQAPATVAGAGMSTYSTPLWAAAPWALAVRFGSSSVASGAAALSLGEKSGRSRRALDTVALAALATELAAAAASHRTYRQKHVSAALDGGWGRTERLGATGAGALLPLGLHAASLLLGRRRSPALSGLALFAVLAGSALLRVPTTATGDEPARRPEISLRYAQPENLPK